jgi:hypothetical protein
VLLVMAGKPVDDTIALLAEHMEVTFTDDLEIW